MNTDIHALSGAYAVDALDDLERARFERHLAECEDCREEVAGLAETAALLAGTVEVAPPAHLKDRVMADIAMVRPLPPQISSQPTASTTSTHPTRSTRRLRFAPRMMAAAAAVVVLGAGAAAVFHPWTDQAGQQSVSLADQVLSAPDASRQTVALDGGAEATLYRSPSLKKAVLVTKAMPALPSDKVYELWLQTTQGVMVPAGLMKSAGNQKFVLEGDAAAAQAAGITVEPAGGSQVPTSDAIALFEFGDAT